MTESIQHRENRRAVNPPRSFPQRSACLTLRLLIIARPLLHRQGLELVLSSRPGILVVASVATAQEALAAIRRSAPQVVVIDLTDPLALHVVRRITDEAGGTKVVGLATCTSEDSVVAAVEAGVAALVGPETGVNELISTFAAVQRGEHPCSPRVTGIMQRRLQQLARTRPISPGRERLTARELDVMTLIDEGLSNKEIAKALDIQLSTVKNHLHNIFEKLEVHDRAEASARLRGELVPAHAVR